MIGSWSRFTLRSARSNPFLPHPIGVLRSYHKGFAVLNEEDPEKSQLLEEQAKRRSRRIRVFNRREPDVAAARPPSSSSIKKMKIIQQIRRVMNDPLVKVLLSEIDDEQHALNLVDVELNDLKDDIAQKFMISDKDGKSEVSLQQKTDLHEIEVKFRINDIAKDYINKIKLKRQWFLRSKQNEASKQSSEQKSKTKVVKEGVTKGKWSVEEEQLKEIDKNEIGINFQAKLSTQSSLNQNCYFHLSGIGGNYGLIIRSIDVKDAKTHMIISKSKPFHNLPSSLQKSWYEYLSNDFNLDYNLALYVLAYSNEKEQKEYVNWLGSILEFRTQSLAD